LLLLLLLLTAFAQARGIYQLKLVNTVVLKTSPNAAPSAFVVVIMKLMLLCMHKQI
jgi:hypothetical protein